ncbi:hypothetical protein MJL33_30975, partial [Salmonella enterica subsp. enterica serovar Kentucky]|nr:hypothetical protein [Salmonella enterica subsp. enterica serovar Kentucky]
PTGKDIFELPFVLVETFLLLFSSITYGMAAIAMHKNNKSQVIFADREKAEAELHETFEQLKVEIKEREEAQIQLEQQSSFLRSFL